MNDELVSNADSKSHNSAYAASRNQSKVKQVWRQSRKSLLVALLVAAVYGICFAALAVQLPKLTVSTMHLHQLKVLRTRHARQSLLAQASERHSLGAFPPRTLPDIVAWRDLTKRYAVSFPVRSTLPAL